MCYVGHSTLVGQRPLKSTGLLKCVICVVVLTCYLLMCYVGHSTLVGQRPLKSTGLNQTQNEVFRHFLEFGSLIFLEIAYNDSLQQCLTSNKGKTRGKYFWGSNLG